MLIFVDGASASQINSLNSTCSSVQISTKYTFAYGLAQLDALSVPIGTIVEARNPRGNTVGCFEVATQGLYGLMAIYGEETVSGTLIPGMLSGETVIWRINGIIATANTALVWSNDSDSHSVTLSATSPRPITRRAFIPNTRRSVLSSW